MAGRPRKHTWDPKKKADVANLKKRVEDYIADLMVYTWKYWSEEEFKVKEEDGTYTMKTEIVERTFHGNKELFEIFRKKNNVKMKDVFYETYDGMNKVPTYFNLAMHLGLSKATIYRYKETPEFREIFELYETIIEASLTDNLIMGTGNKTGIIFFLKNHHGYTDSPEEAIRTGLVNLSDTELMRKAAELQSKLGINDKHKIKLKKEKQ